VEGGGREREEREGCSADGVEDGRGRQAGAAGRTAGGYVT